MKINGKTFPYNGASYLLVSRREHNEGETAIDDCISRLRLRKLYWYLNTQLDLHYEGKRIPPISGAHQLPVRAEGNDCER